jgi:hypothetical protein
LSDQIDIQVQTKADTSGLTAAEQAAQKSAAEFAKLNADQQKAATAAARAAEAQQRLATETARTAQASNQAAVAAQRLATEEQRTAAAASTAAAAQSRAEVAALRLAKAQEQAANASQRGATFAQQLGQAYTSSLMSIVGPAAIAAASIAAVGKAGELAQLGAQAQLVETRFNSLAQSAGTTGDAILTALRKASGGEISDLNLQLAANRAQLLGVADSAQEFSVLLSIARDRAQQMGISTTQAFNDLVTGLGRGSALILDNLGIIVSVDEANKAYAASIGKTVAQLSEAEKKQALINQVLAQGRASLDATGGAVDSMAGDFARLGAASDNAKTATGELLAILLKYPAKITTEILIKATDGIRQITEFDDNLEKTGATAVAVSGSYDEYSDKLKFVNEQLQSVGASIPGLSRAQFEYAKSLIQSGAGADEAVAKTKQYGDVIDAVKQTSGDWLATNAELQGQLIAVASAGGGYADAIHNLSGALLAGNISQETFASATAMVIAQQEIARQAAAEEARETRRLSGAHLEAATSAFDLAAASQADTQSKELQTLQTHLLNEQVQIATNAFLAANPAINASGIQAMVTAGAISPLIGRLAELTVQIRQAKAELGAISMGRPETGGDAIARNLNNAAASQRFLTAQTERAAEAQRQQVLATGTQAQKVKILQENYDAAVRSFGKGSAEAINAQTKLIQAQQREASGGRGGRGGGAGKPPRVSEAEKTATRLADIEKSAGDKLADINEQTQQKLLAIDEKYAEQRAQAMRDLNDEMARMSSGAAFDQQLNDFDQFQKDLSDEQKAALKAREEAEQRYNQRIAAAQEEARQIAANGDADYAKDVLKIREDQAKRQQEIEARAAQANIDTGGKQQAAIAQQAAEATKANEDQANTELAIAKAKADEKAGAQQAEKDAVIAAANEQRDKVVGAAEDQAAKVKGASDAQKNTVISNLQAQAQAAKDWADSISSSARQAQGAMRGVSGPSTGGESEGETASGGETPTASGGGGGGQGIRAGARGGARSVGGGDSIQGAISTLNDAAEIIKILKPFVAANKGALKLLNEYKSTVESAIGSLLAIQRLRQQLVTPAPVLDPNQVLQLKADLEFVLNTMVFIDASATKKVRVFAKYLETEKSAIEILTQAQQLRRDLASPTPPINPAYVAQLLADANQVVSILSSNFIPLKQRQVDDLKRYAETEGASIQILNDVLDLRERLASPPSMAPIAESVMRLARQAAGIVQFLQTVVVPITEQQAAEMGRFADATNASVDTLTAVLDLREALAEPRNDDPIADLVRQYGRQAAGIVQYMQSVVIPLTEDQADLFDRFGGAASAAIGALTDVIKLRQELVEPVPPIPPGLIIQLAQEVRRVTQIFLAQLLPTTEEQAQAAEYFADRAGAAVDTLSAIASLRDAAAELAGPIPEPAIRALAAEASRIVQIVTAQILPTTEEQADAAQRWADRVGGVVDTLTAVAGLRKEGADLTGPIPEATIQALAAEAQRITQIVVGRMLPTTEDLAEAAQRYRDTEGAAIEVLSSVAQLRRDATDLAPALSEAQVIRLADDGKRITDIVLKRMLPVSEEQAEAARRFAETEGAAIEAISSVLGMPAKMFTDYQSPSDAQINRVVADANRIIRQVDKAAQTYSTEGLDAAKAFGEATGSVLSAFKEQLLFNQAIGSGDFTVDPAKLAVFEQSMAQTLGVAARLGAQAAAIPAGNIAALQSATAALTSAYESMIRLSAVPFGNLPQLAGGLSAGVGGGGGGGQSIIVNIYNPPPNMNVAGTIQQIKQGIARGAATRH